MEFPWKCGECKKGKHDDCEAMKEDTGEFCECLRCKMVFKRNLIAALQKSEPRK